MRTYWSGIDVQHTCYDELKHRKVIAQGWRDLGDLTSLLGPLYDEEEMFKQVIQWMGDAAYSQDWWSEAGETRADRELDRAPAVMWNLLHLRGGDLVVGVEGTTVRGICQVTEDARTSYRYDDLYEYAQTVSRGVEWIDWTEERFGPPPQVSAQSELGIRNLSSQSDAVVDAWKGQ
jgi:hypothetical protein